MAILGQGNGGNWTLTISHNKTGIEIPATFTYKGASTSFTITDTEQTIETGWETPLGTAILLEDITRVYDEVVVGNRKYKVSSDDFTIKAYEEEEHEISQTITVSPMNTRVSNGTPRQLTVTMHTYVDGVETATTNVTSAATYTRSNSAITVSNGGKITWNNNSTAETTATVTVSYPSAGVEPVVVNVTVTGKAVEPEPEYNISVNPTSLAFDYLSNEEKTFAVNLTGITSVNITASGEHAEKFTVTPTTGANNTTVTVKTNETNSPMIAGQSSHDYIATVTVSDKSEGTDKTGTVSVRQKYQPYMQQVNPTVFPATGGTISFTVHTEYDIVFRSVPSWITISLNGTTYSQGQRISSGVADNQTFTLTAEANTETTSRSVSSTFNMGHYIGNELQNRVSYFSFSQEAATPVYRSYEIPWEMATNLADNEGVIFELRADAPDETYTTYTGTCVGSVNQEGYMVLRTTVENPALTLVINIMALNNLQTIQGHIHYGIDQAHETNLGTGDTVTMDTQFLDGTHMLCNLDNPNYNY